MFVNLLIFSFKERVYKEYKIFYIDIKQKIVKEFEKLNQ